MLHRWLGFWRRLPFHSCSLSNWGPGALWGSLCFEARLRVARVSFAFKTGTHTNVYRGAEFKELRFYMPPQPLYSSGEPRGVVQARNPSSWETKVSGSRVQSFPGLCSKPLY